MLQIGSVIGLTPATVETEKTWAMNTSADWNRRNRILWPASGNLRECRSPTNLQNCEYTLGPVERPNAVRSTENWNFRAHMGMPHK